jgi:hypothetical protein
MYNMLMQVHRSGCISCRWAAAGCVACRADYGGGLAVQQSCCFGQHTSFTQRGVHAQYASRSGV